MLANCLFSRNPERPFDIERPRNWGSFGAEAVAKGWFQMLFGRLVSGGKCSQIVFFLGIQSGRLLVEAF